jgi:hypothetical protein
MTYSGYCSNWVKIGGYVIGVGKTMPCVCPPHKVNLWKQAQTMGIFGAVKFRRLRASTIGLNSILLKLKRNPGQKLYKRTHNNWNRQPTRTREFDTIFSDKSHKHIVVKLSLLVYQFSWRSVWSTYRSETTRTSRGSWRGFWRVFGSPRFESRPRRRLSSPRFILVFLSPTIPQTASS